jgi:hypothetical protein
MTIFQVTSITLTHKFISYCLLFTGQHKYVHLHNDSERATGKELNEFLSLVSEAENCPAQQKVSNRFEHPYYRKAVLESLFHCLVCHV